MFYILKSDKTYNVTPEQSYNGLTMQFRRGFFIFDTDETDELHWEHNGQIEIGGERFHIYDSMKNNLKIQARFLKLKLEEMENNGFSFYMPTTYNTYKSNFNKLIEDYPEYLI